MQKIASCRFSLSVMSDNYKDVILNALTQVDITTITSSTDLLSTTYIGDYRNVIGTLQAVFSAVNDNKTHITMEATLSPVDIPQEITDSSTTTAAKDFIVHGKIAIYPLGIPGYQNYIDYLIELGQNCSLYQKSSQHGFEFCGDIIGVFKFIQNFYHLTETEVNDFVIQLSLSINSPSLKRGAINHV